MELKEFIDLVQAKHGAKFKGHKLFCEFYSFYAYENDRGEIIKYRSGYEDTVQLNVGPENQFVTSRELAFGIEERTSGKRTTFFVVGATNKRTGLIFNIKVYKKTKSKMFSAITQELVFVKDPLTITDIFNSEIINTSVFVIIKDGIEKEISDLNEYVKSGVKDFTVVGFKKTSKIKYSNNEVVNLYKDELNVFNRSRFSLTSN